MSHDLLFTFFFHKISDFIEGVSRDARCKVDRFVHVTVQINPSVFMNRFVNTKQTSRNITFYDCMFLSCHVRV